MSETALVKRGKCPSCDAPVILSEAGGRPEAFELAHARMLVVLAFPELEGEKRVALGPCQDGPKPLHREGEEPVVYFGHAKHRCIEN